MWIRVFYMLRYNEFLGKLTGVLEKLLYDMLVFFCFFLIEVMFFSCVAQLAFRNVEQYNSIHQAFKNLFYASFGQFDFGQFNDAEFGEWFGIAFMIIFLIVNIGLFMSLFTSMMVTLYSAYVEKQTVYHMLETLKIRPQTSPDKRYSALISLPPPINVILVIFAPILLCTKNPELWNKVILWIAYLPVLCFSFFIYLVYTAALLPLSFVKLFFHKMIMIFMYSKSYRVHKSDKFMQWVIFAVIGLFRITANFLVDLIAFVQHCVM